MDRSRIDHGVMVKPSVEGHGESSSDDGDLRIFAVEVCIIVGVEKDDPNIVIHGLVLREGRVASNDAALAREHMNTSLCEWVLLLIILVMTAADGPSGRLQCEQCSLRSR